MHGYFSELLALEKLVHSFRKYKRVSSSVVLFLVKKINKNPKIRIKIIYFYFDFFNKLFLMRIFNFLVFFSTFFAQKNQFLMVILFFENLIFSKNDFDRVFHFFHHFWSIKNPRAGGDIFFYFIFLTRIITKSLTPSNLRWFFFCTSLFVVFLASEYEFNKPKILEGGRHCCSKFFGKMFFGILVFCIENRFFWSEKR